jgi:hypothetical protein
MGISSIVWSRRKSMSQQTRGSIKWVEVTMLYNNTRVRIYYASQYLAYGELLLNAVKTMDDCKKEF